jgi:hypothetical protein
MVAGEAEHAHCTNPECELCHTMWYACKACESNSGSIDPLGEEQPLVVDHPTPGTRKQLPTKWLEIPSPDSIDCILTHLTWQRKEEHKAAEDTNNVVIISQLARIDENWRVLARVGERELVRGGER